jgi:UDP-glucose:(heptosyl)LPS alpha-1,3-glucosyltransferase
MQTHSLRSSLEIEESDFVILFVGNEFDRKGLLTVVEALRILADRTIKVIVLGDDDPGPYRARAGGAAVVNQLRFLGGVRGPDRYFGAADTLVLPTWYEPFGMVIIEAMASGLPVITSAMAGAVEDLVDGTHGLFLKDPVSADELVAAITRLREDAALRGILARAGREAAYRFAWPKIAAETLKAYTVAIVPPGNRG